MWRTMSLYTVAGVSAAIGHFKSKQRTFPLKKVCAKGVERVCLRVDRHGDQTLSHPYYFYLSLRT